jgi:hypothetical protein
VAATSKGCREERNHHRLAPNKLGQRVGFSRPTPARRKSGALSPTSRASVSVLTDECGSTRQSSCSFFDHTVHCNKPLVIPLLLIFLPVTHGRAADVALQVSDGLAYVIHTWTDSFRMSSCEFGVSLQESVHLALRGLHIQAGSFKIHAALISH